MPLINGIIVAKKDGVNADEATAISSDILLGKTALVGKELITGTMPERAGETINAIFNSGSNGYVLGNISLDGHIDSTSKIKLSIPNLIPSNIKSGVTIGGVTGTYTATSPPVTEQNTTTYVYDNFAPSEAGLTQSSLPIIIGGKGKYASATETSFTSFKRLSSGTSNGINTYYAIAGSVAFIQHSKTIYLLSGTTMKQVATAGTYNNIGNQAICGSNIYLMDSDTVLSISSSGTTNYINHSLTYEGLHINRGVGDNYTGGIMVSVKDSDDHTHVFTVNSSFTTINKVLYIPITTISTLSRIYKIGSTYLCSFRNTYGTYQLYKSTDGSNWTYVDNIKNEFSLIKDGSYIYYFSNSGVLKRTSDGNTWSNYKTIPANVTALTVVSGKVYAVSTDTAYKII